ncbi:unnamed protein product [Toxocara canis]|uniref:Uncharacterized protein n=1 Tax=Toxocara canis TaxID=6265 RepID=A0A183TX76_TOXCA|nr:unnamed protein product [Toxocara canis]
MGSSRRHPLRASWKIVRDKVHRYASVATDASLTAVAQRASSSFLDLTIAASLQKNVYTIIVRFIDQLLEMRESGDQASLCRKFGRQLASALRAIPFDQGICWSLFENRLLYYLVASRCNVRTLLAWHVFIEEMSSTVLQAFCQAAIADLPNPMPTIFEETPIQCFHFECISAPSNFLTKLLSKFVCFQSTDFVYMAEMHRFAERIICAIEYHQPIKISLKIRSQLIRT